MSLCAKKIYIKKKAEKGKEGAGKRCSQLRNWAFVRVGGVLYYVCAPVWLRTRMRREQLIQLQLRAVGVDHQNGDVKYI